MGYTFFFEEEESKLNPEESFVTLAMKVQFTFSNNLKMTSRPSYMEKGRVYIHCEIRENQEVIKLPHKNHEWFQETFLANSVLNFFNKTFSKLVILFERIDSTSPENLKGNTDTEVIRLFMTMVYRAISRECQRLVLFRLEQCTSAGVIF